ncbi:MAG: Spy/CpxP family protein refolding chaperone [Ignavibacteriales bacterium]|nr:Spy/CpxP family protein refolding chaperone [Ignavibacteriales bacterium]
MKKYIAMGVVLVLISTAYFGCRSHNDEDRAKHHEKRAEWIVEKITDELDLTAEQQKTLNAIKEEVLVKHNEVKELRSGVMNDLYSVLDKETIDETELNAMFAQREAKIKELREFAVAKYAQFHNSLTKEQKTKLKEKMEKYRKYRG